MAGAGAVDAAAAGAETWELVEWALVSSSYYRMLQVMCRKTVFKIFSGLKVTRV